MCRSYSRTSPGYFDYFRRFLHQFHHRTFTGREVLAITRDHAIGGPATLAA